MEAAMFQPPDPPEPDYDAMRDAEYDRYEKLGYAIISRDEWRAKLDEAARDGYAEGRKDERAAVDEVGAEELQPSAPPDRDAMWAYAEGRKDEREAIVEVITRAGFALRVLPSGEEALIAVHPEARL
jgi:hypothetical protein